MTRIMLKALLASEYAPQARTEAFKWATAIIKRYDEAGLTTNPTWARTYVQMINQGFTDGNANFIAVQELIKQGRKN